MTIVRNILAVIAGFFIGGGVNMFLITISGDVIPLPEGADGTTTEGLKASIHLFQPKHFIMPFLAHAIGTFVGALIAGMIAGSHKMKFAMAIGICFLLGGIASVFMIPGPTWFAVVDLTLAYIPMGYLAGRLTNSQKSSESVLDA